jgi:pyridoxal phosphate enzyme (YggS family)
VAPAVGPLDLERMRSNVVAVRERITAACTRTGRDPSEVELLAATKYVGTDQLGVVADAGIELVGENIASDLAEKHARWHERLVFDFIGHLQSRKTSDVLPLVRLVHSVESESVLRRIERHTTEQVGVLMEVNVSGEPSKHGLAPADVDSFLETASGYSHVRFDGLMTMPPLVAEPEVARPYFVALRELAERLRASWAPRHDFHRLSMGTSQDFEVAVEEGSTVVRVGSVLYA